MSTPDDARAAAALRHRQIVFAGTYDGYARLAPPAELGALLDRPQREHAATGVVPAWCGIDLLRGWAFFLVRADRHGGGYALALGGTREDEWLAVLGAIARHPLGRELDVPLA